MHISLLLPKIIYEFLSDIESDISEIESDIYTHQACSEINPLPHTASLKPFELLALQLCYLIWDMGCISPFQLYIFS